MEKLINEILLEESEKTGIAANRLEHLAEYGCNIAFKDDLRTRVKLFGGNDFFTKETLKEFILVLVDGATARLEAENYQYSSINDDDNWDLIEKNFMLTFNNLPVLYEINGFKIRDIKSLNGNLTYIGLFIENYKSNFSEYYDNVFFDDDVAHKIEMECIASRFLSMDEIVEVIKERFLSYDDDDNELYGKEFLLKHRDKAKMLLSDMGKIMEIMWDNTFYLQQEYSFLDKSLFISMYHSDYNLPWEDWKELGKIANE